MRVRFSTNGTIVSSFLVQLEAIHDGEWKAVRRYDAHGQPHLDFLDQRGREYRKVWLDDNTDTVLTFAIHDFLTYWELYVSEFLEGTFG